MRVLFIIPYPEGEAPSQRFRFEQYLQVLRERGIDYKLSSFLDKKSWIFLYKHGYFFIKVSALIKGYFHRIKDIFSLGKYDVVFIHREASPFGPPVFEWLITKVFKKYTIYDFDDAIWIPNASSSNSTLTFSFKRFKNVYSIIKWSNVVSVGNKYLKEFAEQYNSHVVYNPTTIDTNHQHNKLKSHTGAGFVIGWTGSHSTLPYLEPLVPILEELESQFTFEIHVICDVPPKWNLKSLRFVKWSKQTEIEDLLKFDVGIMPLPDDIWSKGKCGFKALQYMALGIPAVVSDAGVNAEIVDNDVNGYVCKSPEDWKKYLLKLLTDPNTLSRLSKNTREKIIRNYSVDSNTENFLSLFPPKHH